MSRRLIEIESLKREQGHCWVAALPNQLKYGDVAGHIPSSELMLFENGDPLGPARAQHDVIRRVGHGAFSHWKDEVWFSTSDNTPPISNGRRYTVVADDVSEGSISTPAFPAVGGCTPVN